jgi:hypothetical protein
MLSRICFFIAIVLLTACTSTPPPPTMQYYLLDTANSRMSGDDGRQVAQVRVISIPDYLNQSAMVMMVDEHKLDVARYHSWADRLIDSIARVVEYEYNRRLAALGPLTDCDSCYDIGLSIEHFYPTSEGEVFLTGYYQYESAEQKIIRQRFSLRGKMPADGYQAATVEMRRLLVELSVLIAQQVK